MPRATHVLVKRLKEDKFVGSNGWTLIIDEVTAVGVTYRAKLVSPDGQTVHPCPTRFRRSKNCYGWARRELRLLRAFPNRKDM